MNKRRRWKAKRRRARKRDAVALYWYYRQASNDLLALEPKQTWFLGDL